MSRNEPPAEFARLRASGSLAEIGWEELRLTREETGAIASLRGECREDAARALHERSEGWAAGLTLLMQQGGRTGGVPDAPRGASPQALFDYFAAEVFDRAADELRQLWLRTAFMPHFSVESARKLSGSEAAERLLDTLYRQRVWALCRTKLLAGDRLMAAAGLLFYLCAMEGVERAHAVVAEFAPLARSPEVPPLQRLTWAWTYTMYYSNLADFKRWRQSNREAQALAVEAGFSFMLASLKLLDAGAMLSEGHAAAAARCLEPLAGDIDRARPSDVALYHFLLAWLALLQERPRTALEHAAKAAGMMQELGSAGPVVFTCGAYSQALAECGELDRALVVAREASARVGAPSGVIRFNALLFEADVLLRVGKREEFLARLAEAFASGRRGGFVNNAQWLPRMMLCLCAEALAAGIETEYVERLIAKRGLVPPSPEVQSWPWPVRIHTLGRFSLVLDGKPLKTSGKPQHRPLELLKALIALGGRQVHGDALIEALWPGGSGMAARKTLQMTLKRLRQLLGSAEAIMLQDGKFTLDPGRCWVDVWALERSLSRVGDALASGGEDSGAGAAEHALVQALALYQGPFLAGEPEHPWLIGMRERMRSRFLRTLRETCLRLEQRQRFDAARALLERALELDPQAEELYRRLMLCLRALGRRAEAIEIYRRCRRQLSIVLGIAPSAETEAVHRLIRGE